MGAIAELIRRRDERVARAQAYWAGLWPLASGVASIDPALLEYFVADMSAESIEWAMNVTARKIPSGGTRVAPYFVAICRNVRRKDLGTASRGAWLALLPCPECNASGLLLTMHDTRPTLACVECASQPQVIRGRLDP
jgi:hypothetical protein